MGGTTFQDMQSYQKNSTMENNYPLVIATWSDAIGSDGWVELDELQTSKLSIHHTVGWLIAEREESLTICQSYDEVNECFGAYVTVPTVNIVNLEYPVTTPMLLPKLP